jgi:hypothetical protein
MTQIQQVDFTAIKRRAKLMTDATLRWNANDAAEAAEMAEDLERNGCRVSKTGGYYRDEASIYRTELRVRFGAKGAI